MPDTSKLEKLNRELEKSEKKLRKAINDEKALQHQLKQLTRKERTHRLCTRGGMLSNGQEDENGILFICFPVTAIAAVLSRSPMTVKRSLNELETAGLIMRVRQGVGEPNRIYVLIPG